MSKFKTLTVPVEVWEWLRSRAYEGRVSMVEVLRGLVAKDKIRACGEDILREADGPDSFVTTATKAVSDAVL